jgi:hypothetical protein
VRHPVHGTPSWQAKIASRIFSPMSHHSSDNHQPDEHHHHICKIYPRFEADPNHKSDGIGDSTGST